MENMAGLEKRVYRTYWEDGLIDLFAAVGVLIIGVSWAFDFPIGGVIAPAVLVPLWGPVRERLILPRLGRVEFADRRESRNRNMLRTALYAGAGLLALGVGAYLTRDRVATLAAAEFAAALPAAILAAMALVASVLIASPRFVVYAGVLLLAGIAGAWKGLEPGRTLLEAGAFILVAALVLLTRFLRANPEEGPQG
ncbi:MAG: hypothetical protein P8102_13205 [Gammaproteobacteria bacterium]